MDTYLCTYLVEVRGPVGFAVALHSTLKKSRAEAQIS